MDTVRRSIKSSRIDSINAVPLDCVLPVVVVVGGGGEECGGGGGGVRWGKSVLLVVASTDTASQRWCVKYCVALFLIRNSITSRSMIW